MAKIQLLDQKTIDNIAAVEQEDTKQTEQEIRQLLLNISM